MFLLFLLFLLFVLFVLFLLFLFVLSGGCFWADLCLFVVSGMDWFGAGTCWLCLSNFGGILLVVFGWWYSVGGCICCCVCSVGGRFLFGSLMDYVWLLFCFCRSMFLGGLFLAYISWWNVLGGILLWLWICGGECVFG